MISALSVADPRSRSVAVGASGEIVECREHLARLPHPVADEAGELGENAHLGERSDGALRVLRCDTELGGDGGGVDDGLADEQVGQKPRCRPAGGERTARGRP